VGTGPLVEALQTSSMIISDERGFVFIRNPKCAGVTIRHQLVPYDSYRGEFTRVATHPVLGPLDFSHLPLAILRDYFPEPFQKVCNYNSYAIIRDPRTRFASAVFYHLRRFQRIEVSRASFSLLEKKALELCAKLRSEDERRKAEFVHFTRQADFVQLDGNAIVRNLYLFEDLPRFAMDFQARYGIGIDLSTRRNRSRTSDNSLVKAAKALGRPLYYKLFSEGRRKTLQRTLNRVVKNSPQGMYTQLLANKSVSAFIDDYYGDDIALYRELRKPQPSTVNAQAIAFNSPLSATKAY